MIKTSLWPHQRKIVEFILGRSASIIGAEMGTGKTLAALAALSELNPDRCLIVTTKRGLAVWKNQIDTHTTDMSYRVLDASSTNEKLKQLGNNDTPYVILNYDCVWRTPILNWLLKWKPSVILLDESHKIKSAGGTVSRKLHVLGKTASVKVAMSGTVFADNPLDVYGQARFVDDTLFNKYYNGKQLRLSTNFNLFRAYYCDLIPLAPNIYKVVGYKNTADFTNRLSKVYLQIKADDVLELPEYSHIVRSVTLSNKATNYYKELKKEGLLNLPDGTLSVANVLVKALRLMQLTGGYATLDGQNEQVSVDTSKLEELEDIVSSLPLNEPVVVFCKFTAELNHIYALLSKDYSCSRLSGTHNELDDWNTGKSKALVVQIDAGAEAIDLTRSRYAVYYSKGYDLAKYEQSLARLRRPGADLKSKIYYYHLIAQNTIDEIIHQALQDKRDVIDSIRRSLDESS